jgi:hypothetical protein
MRVMLFALWASATVFPAGLWAQGPTDLPVILDTSGFWRVH